MKRTLLSLIVTAALFFGMAGAQPALALGAVTLTATGWSDPLAGTWDATTGVATLEQDVAGLTIQANIAASVTVEGNGHKVTGTGASQSVGVNISGWTTGQLTVKNLVITGFSRGIWLNGSSGVTLQGHNISGCGYGIYLQSSSNNTVSGNTTNVNTYHGIYLYYGQGNKLAGNTVQHNSADGIHLFYSNSNELTDNTLSFNHLHGIFIEYSNFGTLARNAMADNGYNFRMDGSGDDSYNQTIDESNTVGGKPILYVRGATGGTYGASTNAGTVYLVNCDGVTVSGLTLSGNSFGIRLWSTTNSIIEGVQAAGNMFGIYLQKSSFNTVRSNTVSDSSSDGINLYNSSSNTVVGNTIERSIRYGLNVNQSNDNLVYGNQFLSNSTQAYLASSNCTGNLFCEADPIEDPIGGNYWSDYAAQGLTNPDGDRFLEPAYTFPDYSVYSKDEMPLADPPTGDRIPPQTTYELAGTEGTSPWYVSDVQVTLSATDNPGGSGVKYSEYSFDNVTWIRYEAPFPVTDEGTTTLYYRSVDNDFNTETDNEPVVLKIDKTPPALTQTAILGDAGQDNWYRSDVTVTFSAVDAVSGLANPADATVTLPASGEGAAVTTDAHVVYDQAGNSATAGPLTFKIDKAPPVTVGTPATAQSGPGWYNTDVQIVWSATDALSGVDPTTMPGPSAIGGEGAGLGATASGQVYDLAGNADALASVSGINIDRTPPTITITTPQPYAVLQVGTTLDFSATDALSGMASVTGSLDSGDTTQPVSSGDAPATGVYTLIVKATDVAGNVATETREFVVYNPNGGYVTGGGWFTSAPGAYPANPTLTGKASFGFVSKYTKGVVPNGQTEFHFQAAGLNFHSSAYDWLVVSGSKATFKGTGTIAGRAGSYKFTMVAIDDVPDRVRIKIVDQATGIVVYDSNLGADETNGPTTPIGGGSISVKKG